MRKDRDGHTGVVICCTGYRSGMGTTTGMTVLAAGLSLAGCRVLMIGDRSLQEGMFGGRSGTVSGFCGMDEIMRLFRSGPLDGKDIEACTVCMRDSLFFLQMSKPDGQHPAEDEITRGVVRRVIRECTREFDCVLIDMDGYRESDSGMSVDADALVVSIPQDPEAVNRLESDPRYAQRRSFYLINRYDRMSENDLVALRVRCRKLRHDNTWVIPYDTGLHDAMTGKRALRYLEPVFTRKQGMPESLAGTESLFFRSSVNRAVMQLILQLQIPLSGRSQGSGKEGTVCGYKKTGIGKKRLFG